MLWEGKGALGWLRVGELFPFGPGIKVQAAGASVRLLAGRRLLANAEKPSRRADAFAAVCFLQRPEVCGYHKVPVTTLVASSHGLTLAPATGGLCGEVG